MKRQCRATASRARHGVALRTAGGPGPGNPRSAAATRERARRTHRRDRARPGGARAFSRRSRRGSCVPEFAREDSVAGEQARDAVDYRKNAGTVVAKIVTGHEVERGAADRTGEHFAWRRPGRLGLANEEHGGLIVLAHHVRQQAMLDDFTAELARDAGEAAAISVLLDSLPRRGVAELERRLEEHHPAAGDPANLGENVALAAVIRLDGVRGIDDVVRAVRYRDVKKIAGEEIRVLESEAAREFARAGNARPRDVEAGDGRGPRVHFRERAAKRRRLADAGLEQGGRAQRLEHARDFRGVKVVFSAVFGLFECLHVAAALQIVRDQDRVRGVLRRAAQLAEQAHDIHLLRVELFQLFQIQRRLLHNVQCRRMPMIAWRTARMRASNSPAPSPLSKWPRPSATPITREGRTIASTTTSPRRPMKPPATTGTPAISPRPIALAISSAVSRMFAISAVRPGRMSSRHSRRPRCEPRSSASGTIVPTPASSTRLPSGKASIISVPMIGSRIAAPTSTALPRATSLESRVALTASRPSSALRLDAVASTSACRSKRTIRAPRWASLIASFQPDSVAPQMPAWPAPISGTSWASSESAAWASASESR